MGDASISHFPNKLTWRKVWCPFLQVYNRMQLSLCTALSGFFLGEGLVIKKAAEISITATSLTALSIHRTHKNKTIYKSRFHIHLISRDARKPVPVFSGFFEPNCSQAFQPGATVCWVLCSLSILQDFAPDLQKEKTFQTPNAASSPPD